jgi:hypothetical protein
METGRKGKLAKQPLHSAKDRNDRHVLLLRKITALRVAKVMANFWRVIPHK